MGRADWLASRPVAHRGYHDAAAGRIENTTSAVAAAVERGFGVEIDIHLSSDGEAFVFHDLSLDRLTEGRGAVATLTMAELRAVPFRQTRDRIPTLGDVLDIVGGRVPVFIEIKSFGGNEPWPLVARAADILKSYAGPAAMMSFDPGAVSAMADLAPDVARGIIADDCRDDEEWAGFSRTTRFYLRNMLHFPKTRPDFVNYWIKALPAPAPNLLRTFGVPLLTWTVRTPDDRARAARWADQIVFEGFDPETSPSPARDVAAGT
ncbi:glycerophosphodiester phosphodiesterase family protein [Methylobrevis pamukkalensis]|uniref:Glycerophosphoryl diester phosphodiesterase n=1 Tax=Methylobrevis pamukkalensis TaxID=1439726 RepID=A0A1E3H122_9HYPH|nr:glycerophosphodiester phosphodiesterase family protein [Methylobrevis pamukkalensis]ODN70007.1 Glycerophosphoryl diester phosphodiesterase [Methylobrevis pamukkalensis]